MLEREPFDKVDNDRGYEWYCPQKFSNNPWSSCGPAVIKMAAKWYNREFSKSIDEIRDEIGISKGEGISNIDIYDYFKSNNIPYTVIEGSTIKQIIDVLNQGKIIIVGINPTYIRRNFGRVNYKINRNILDKDFIDVGHAIIIKGYNKYKIYDKEFTLFKVYDPGISSKNNKGEYIGKDKYYFAEDIYRGMEELGILIIIINEVM